jgi:hypothetical protein
MILDLECCGDLVVSTNLISGDLVYADLDVR